MATFKINKYCIWLKYSSDTVSRVTSCFEDENSLADILENSIDILVELDRWRLHLFGYDMDTKEIYIIRFTDESIPPNFRYSLKDFIDFLGSLKSGYLYVRTKNDLEGLFPVGTEKIIDWSQTITDLEGKGVVKTAKSDYSLSCDGRKFWFVSDSETVADVDCLGTVLHEDLNEMVLNRWREIFREEETSKTYDF